MNGYLLVDKPKGWTSFDVVNKVRHVIQNSELNKSNKKRFPVGHTGTLDPLATGLLLLLVGDYTKRAVQLTKLGKTYFVTMKLGETSTTGDEEGIKTVSNINKPDLEIVRSAIRQFVGKIEQSPPAFSAVKINGQRAYKLARAGKKVETQPREVEVYVIEDIAYDYPFVNFTAEVSSGTYIRTLVEDIGKVLKTGAYMSDLRRTRIGDFDIGRAIGLENIDEVVISKNLKTLA